MNIDKKFPGKTVKKVKYRPSDSINVKELIETDPALQIVTNYIRNQGKRK